MNRGCCEDGKEVDGSFTVLEGEGLPDETTPAKGEKHVAGSRVEVSQREACGVGNGFEDRVDCCAGDSYHEDVDAHACGGEGFAGG